MPMNSNDCRQPTYRHDTPARYAATVPDRERNAPVVLAAAAAHSLLRLREQRGGVPTLTMSASELAGDEKTDPDSATPEEKAVRHCLRILLQSLLFDEEVPAEIVIEVPTDWPPKFGRDALLLSRQAGGTVTATPATYTGAPGYASVTVARGRAAAIPGDHPLAELTRIEAEDRVPFQGVDAAIARLRALARSR